MAILADNKNGEDFLVTTKTELYQPFQMPSLPQGATLADEGSLDVCAPELMSLPDTRRIMVAGEMAFFPNAGAVTPDVPLQNPDNSRLTRVIRGKNGFQYENVTSNPLLGEQRTNRQMHLCRGATADGAGNYPIYAYDWTANPVLTRTCAQAMSPVQISLSDGEILRVVNDNQLGPPDYCVEPGSGNGVQGGLLFYLRANPFDERDILRIADNVAANPNLSSGRRQQIAAAIRPLADAAIRQRETSEKMDRMMWIMLPGLLIPAYIAARASGMTDRLDSFIINSARAVWDTPGNLVRGDFSTAWRQWSDVFRPRNPVLTDLTERLSSQNIPLTEGGRAILEAFDRGEMTNDIHGGPSGSGKGYDTESAFAAALQGQSGVEAFEGMHLRAYRISVGAIVEKAGSWLNGGEKEFLKALKQVPDGSLVQLTEADQLAKCGMGSGNQPLNLLPRLYNIMEQRPGLFFVLESTRWPEIEAAAPDLLRRAGFSEITPPTPQKLREMLDVGVRMRRDGNKGQVLQRRYNAYTFTSEALDAITALGAYERGAPPSSHLMVMDQVMAEVARSRRGGSGGTEISAEDVIRYVARSTHTDADQVRQNLRGLLAGGVADNPRIEARIVEGFYRAYPTPRSGFVNPVRPNPNPAFIMHDGERIDLPAGSYVSAREAVNAGNPTASPAAPTAPAPGNGAGAQPVIRPSRENIYSSEIGLRELRGAISDIVFSNLWISSNNTDPRLGDYQGEFLRDVVDGVLHNISTQGVPVFEASGRVSPEFVERLQMIVRLKVAARISQLESRFGKANVKRMLQSADRKLADRDYLTSMLERRFSNGGGSPQPPPIAPSGNGAGAPRVVRTGWEEVLTYRVNDRAIYDALIQVDRGLAQYYRDNLSPVGRTVSTMGELVDATRSVNPALLDEALRSATLNGRPVSLVPERGVFEMVVRAAEGRGAFADGDPTARERMAARFETEVRSRSGIEGTEGRPEVDPAERERGRGRRRRAPVAGRP